MQWNDIKAAGFINVHGNDHSVSHLNDAVEAFTIPASGKHPETSFKVLFQFSSHCVSWGPKEGQPIDFNKHGHDCRVIDEKGIHRCFCFDRYALSHNLPRIMKGLPERHCIFTGRENWMTVELVQPDGSRQEYEVFFNVSRQSKHMLRVYVESAYVRDEARAKLRPKKSKLRRKVKGSTLLVKKLRGEPIKMPPA